MTPPPSRAWVLAVWTGIILTGATFWAAVIVGLIRVFG